MTVPYALSVHTFIKNVGADAGFASIIGLAVLVLLYFAQMRESSTLRDHLEEALGRVNQLENRVAHLARAHAAQQAAGPAAAARPPVAPRPLVPLRPMGSAVATLRTHPGNAVNAAVQPRPVPVLAGPPAGLAAPALGSSTKLIPTPAIAEPPVPGQPAPELAPAPMAPPVPVGVPGVGAVSASAEAGPLGTAQTQAGAASTLVEDTVLIPGAGSGNGHAPGGPPVFAPPVPGLTPGEPGAPGAPAEPTEFEQAAAPPPRVHIGRGRHGARRTPVSPRSQASRQPSVARRLVLTLLGLALVAALVVVLVSVTGGATPKSSTTAGKSTTKHKPGSTHHHTTVVFNPATVTVAVLNGTAIYHLAQDVANKLVSAGYKQGAVTNAPVQTQASTVIGYLPGHETAADEVAAALKLSPSAVQQASQPAIVACAGFGSGGGTSTSSSCPADVIVTVGADLQKAASSGTSTE